MKEHRLESATGRKHVKVEQDSLKTVKASKRVACKKRRFYLDRHGIVNIIIINRIINIINTGSECTCRSRHWLKADPSLSTRHADTVDPARESGT